MGNGIERVILIVLDGVGIGELPDAARYGDEGSNTLVNTARAVRGLCLPNMQRLGLGNIASMAGASIEGVEEVSSPLAGYGRMAEASPGKDTMTGHWELMGLILERPFPVYPGGFPPEIVKPFQEAIGRKVLGNKMASGTEIIEELGEEHMRTGFPILYTSADSVFQLASHEEVIPIEELYRMCEIARSMLRGEHGVGRVIARPFTGSPGNFRRTPRRRDYSIEPPRKTLLDFLKESGLHVAGVGKIEDVFSGRGLTASFHATDNESSIEATLNFMKGISSGLIFTNCVDFDTLYGHRNNPEGFRDALERVDRGLGRILEAMGAGDVLIITADHGCDPTTESTDHSREYVPLLVFGEALRRGTCLGTRRTFADVGASIKDMLGVEAQIDGESFTPLLVEAP